MFVDREFERAYQHADQAEGVRRARSASLVAAVVWVVVAVIGPTAVGAAPATAWAICGTMTAFLLATARASRWATTQRRRDAIGLGQQFVAGCAVLVLCVATGTVATYAMPAMMLTAVFGFAVTRYPFVGAIAIGTAHCLLFLGVAENSSLGSQLVLQLFLVAATVVAGCVGAYLLERSQRKAFAQGRQVRVLHERVDLLLRQYLSPEVARTLIEDPARAALGGMEIDVTVLFADLRGYTAFAERRSPTEVVAMLNAAFGACVPIVLEEGGTVVQFMGDALASTAARPSLAISGLRTSATSRRSAIRRTSPLGCKTYAPVESVVIGARTYELIRDIADVRSLGTPALKGESEAVEVYELVGLRADPFGGSLAHREAPPE